MLQLDQRGPNHGQSRHFGRVHAGFFGADGVTYVVAVQQYPAVGEVDVQALDQLRDGRLMRQIQPQAHALGRQCGDAVERAGIQKVVAQPLRQYRRQGAFARGRGAIHADDGDGRSVGSGNGEQRLKVIGECFRHAFRVFNTYRQTGRVKGCQ